MILWSNFDEEAPPGWNYTSPVQDAAAQEPALMALTPADEQAAAYTAVYTDAAFVTEGASEYDVISDAR